jgi:peptidyl-prolyl cis-trans isomerase C
VTQTNTDNSKVLAVVNGKSITQNMYDTYVQQRDASRTQPHGKVDPKVVIDEMVNFELLLQDAEKKNLDKEADVAAQLELQRRNVLASAAFRNYTRNNPITEEIMRKDYEDRMSRIDLTEYKLRHTLNDKQEDAKAVVAELDKGKAFADVAKKLSSGPSAAEGGDLGWLSPQDMVPGFKAAAIELEQGKYTAPVKTQFGWHVIYLEETRKSPPPPFEQVREQVAGIMQRKQIDDYILRLRSTAVIDIKQEQSAPTAPVLNPTAPAAAESDSKLHMDQKQY